MQFIYNLLYEPGIPLQIMGLIVGISLILSHGFALLRPELVKAALKKFPRNESIGVPLTVIGFIWGFIIWSCMDLGEFFRLERPVQIIIIGVCVGFIIHVREFIAVRALGFLMILAAAPILESAFLQEPVSRLLLVAYAYAIALKGMFWVGMPYLLRDQINWVLAKDSRYRIGFAAGLVYGIAVVICAISFW